MCNLLSHRNIVPLVGAWSTGAHPLGLVYEYMPNLDLRQYLRNEPNVRRLILVHVPMFPRSTNRLTLVGNSLQEWLKAWTTCITWASPTEISGRYVGSSPHVDNSHSMT